MTGASDQYTTIGNEAVAYGTRAATLTRAVGQEPGNNPSPRVEHRPSGGFWPGSLGDPEAFHVVDVRGGTYPLVVDLLNKTQGLIWASATATANAVITTPMGATDARLLTITPSDWGLRSTTIHDAIALADGTLDHIDYLGGKAMDFGLSVAPKGNVKLKVNYDYKTMDTSAASVTPAIPSSPWVYKDTDVTTTLGGSAICVRGVDFTIPTGIKIDADRVCPGGREEPIVQDVVRPTGTIGTDLASLANLDDWIAGTSRSLVYSIAGPNIESGKDCFVRVTFAAVKKTGGAPERDKTQLTGQPVTWQAFDNGTDPLWKVEIQSADVAL